MPKRIQQDIRITEEQIEVLRERRRQLDSAITTLEMFQRQSYRDLMQKMGLELSGNKLCIPIDSPPLKQLKSGHEQHSDSPPQGDANRRASSSAVRATPRQRKASARGHSAA